MNCSEVNPFGPAPASVRFERYELWACGLAPGYSPTCADLAARRIQTAAMME